MRSLSLTFAVLIFSSNASWAQTSGTPGSKAQLPSKESVLATPPELSAKNKGFLDAYLKAWEDRMASVNSIETKCSMTETADGVKLKLTGEASIMKPNFAKLLIKDPVDPTNSRRWRHYSCDGQYFRDYTHATKICRTQEFSKDDVGDNTLFRFLFGMKADELKRRYHLSIDVDDPVRTTDFYLHITILPKVAEDLREFKKAELVLWKNNKDPKLADAWMLPARLWFQSTNGDQTMWEFNDLVTTKKLTAKDFIAPPFREKDWKAEWITPPKSAVKTVGGKRP